MSKTYIDLCNELVRDVGIGAEVANTASPKQGELRNVTRWIRNACEDIDKLFFDWRYLHRQYDNTTTPGEQALPSPGSDPVRQWDRTPGAFRVQDDNGNWSVMAFTPWKDYQDSMFWETTDQQMPWYWTVKPDNTVLVYPTPNDAYSVRGFYWRRSSQLINNGDEPLMPDEHRLVIVAAAKIKYGDREDAPEIITGAETEYNQLLASLMADQLPGQRRSKMAEVEELEQMGIA